MGYLGETGLSYFWQKVKAYVDKKVTDGLTAAEEKTLLSKLEELK